MVISEQNSSKHQPPATASGGYTQVKVDTTTYGEGATERYLLALPARLGGMGIRNPVQSAQNEFQFAIDITKSLSDQISQQNANYSFEVLEKQLSAAKARVKSQRRLSLKAKADNLRESLPSSLQLAMDLSKEKGASNWLTVLLTANLLTETCHGVAIEPTLQSVSSEQLNGATANSHIERAFFLC